MLATSATVTRVMTWALAGRHGRRQQSIWGRAGRAGSLLLPDRHLGYYLIDSVCDSSTVRVTFRGTVNIVRRNSDNKLRFTVNVTTTVTM